MAKALSGISTRLFHITQAALWNRFMPFIAVYEDNWSLHPLHGLTKNVIQVCIYKNKKMQSNIEMTPSEFNSWLITTKPAFIVFEACATSNYWKQKATLVGLYDNKYESVS